MSMLSKIFGDANARYIKSLQPVVDRINSLEAEFEKLSDEELRAKTIEFKKRIAESGELEAVLTEAFTAVREAARRTLGQRHFDVQLMGGIVLHRGKIAEMKTGEGKTLVATLPAYLNALEGKGVHVITVNDYLARRDVAWMGQIYHLLGLSVGCINHDSSYVYDPLHSEKIHEANDTNSKSQIPNHKQIPNSNDQNKKLDEIRDTTGSFHVVHEFLRPVARREAYRADITYGTNNEYGFDYLRDNMAYEVGQMSQREPARTNDIAQSGGHHFAIVDEVDSILIDEARTPLIISAPDEDSGKLYETFSKIVPRLSEGDDYTVDEKLKAVSITESGIEKIEKILGISNIYEEGGVRHVHHLEQALKAHVLFKRDKDYVVKDGEVMIVDEFTGRLMPGRRWSEGLHQAVEAKEGVQIQKESRTLATITFQNYFRMYGKLAGMTGTARTSAEEFHKVYNLDVISVPTNKPMARKDTPDRIYKTEAGKFKAIAREIKERHQNGQPVLVGTVSIERNELLSAMLNREGVPHNVLNAKNHEREAEIISQAGRPGAVTVATNMAGRGVDIILGGNPPNPEDAQRTRDTGGLHVIGTERHEARRIDDQLRGRAGRQGDPGSSNFYVSMEDELVRVFGGDRLKNLMDRLGVGEDDVIENRFVSSAIEQAQSKIEGHNFDIRKYVLEYDDVMNKHRDAVYRIRKEILFADNNKNLVLEWISAYIENAEEQYDKKEQEIGPDMMKRLERFVLLRVIDQLWLDHIEAMEHLRDSVRLRAYGQRDPLIEYKIEAQGMFKGLMEAMKAQVANLIFKAELTRRPEQPRNIQESRPDISGESGHKHQEVINEPAHRQTDSNNEPKVGRNDPCWCGSGKKYKRCHGS